MRVVVPVEALGTQQQNTENSDAYTRPCVRNGGKLEESVLM